MIENVTTLAFSNLTTLPITVTSTTSTNWAQFTIGIIFASLGVLFYMWLILKDVGISGLFVQLKLKKLTGKPTLVISHKPDGSIFSSGDAMVGPKTLSKVTKFLNKHQGKSVNIVLNTPGGYVFYGQQIAHVLNSSDVTAYVPSMSMSAGTLLALSCKEVRLGPQATLGPVDPQLGYFWGVRSADSFKKTVEFKGAKVDDSTYAFFQEGEKCRSEIYEQIKTNVQAKEPELVAKYLTDGRLTHGARLTYDKLIVDLGIKNVSKMTDKEFKITSRCV